MNLNPLSVDEFDRLNSFLASDRMPPECLDFEGIEGLFAAAICSPAFISPLSAIHEACGRSIPWESEVEKGEIYGLLLRHWDYLAAGFGSGEWEAHLAEKGPRKPGVAWANGFIKGMKLYFDAWQVLLRDQKSSAALLPITALSDIFEEKTESKGPIVCEERESLSSQLHASTMAIFEYWGAARKNVALAASAAQRNSTGHNGPCPCGSGKKFKQCCGKSGK